MRFSLATMLVITAYAAIGCMSLVHPAYHWTSLVWNTSLIMLAIATVGALVARGKDRAYWSGFAFCGWAHYMFSLGPWMGGHLNAYIFSRPLLDFVCELLEHERVVDVMRYDRFLTTEPHLNFFMYNEKLRLYVYFLISGFAIMSVVCGLLGGWLANYLFLTLGGGVPRETATVDDTTSVAVIERGNP